MFFCLKIDWILKILSYCFYCTYPIQIFQFYLVAHSSEKSQERAAVAIDNMRVAICDTRGFAPDYIDETTDFENVL